MNGAKKAFNILGIVLAWLLSVALVVLLVVTPVVFSALSLLSTDTITKAVAQNLGSSAEAPEQTGEVQIVQLSDTAEENTSGSADMSEFGELDKLFGDNISQESMEAILSSKVVAELMDTYLGDVANAFTGDSSQTQFNSEKIKTVVNENIDEFAEVLQKNVPELADMDMAELKSKVLEAVDESADEIVNALPKPEEIVGNNPGLGTVLQILAKKDTIKLAVVGVIVVLSALIFVCRIPGLRGFRWLATNLFVGGGFGAFTTVGLLISKSAVGEIAQQSGAQVAGVVGALLSDFTGGMLVRTIVMLASGGALLTVYILLKKLTAKKLEAAQHTEEQPVEEVQA